MNEKRIVEVKGAAPADLPLSRGVAYGSLLFVSGTVATDLQTGQPLFGTVEQETEQVLKNIEKVLQAAGSGLEHVLKTTVFLTRKQDFAKMNEVYRRYFPARPPARSTVVVELAADYQVEIEAVAYIPGNG